MFEEESEEKSPRKMFEGNWKCVKCGKEITELPFEPTRDVYCRDCYSDKRKQRF